MFVLERDWTRRAFGRGAGNGGRNPRGHGELRGRPGWQIRGIGASVSLNLRYLSNAVMNL